MENDISFIINQLGEDRSQYFNAIAPPLIQTSNFALHTVDALRKAFENEMDGYIYSRGLNPTVDILRKKLAALDGAEDCLLFNSGIAAIYAGVMANVKSGDHILSVKRPYSWVQHLFDKILPRFGVVTTYIDGTKIENFERGILPNTTFIYLESPNSWFFDLQDITAVAELAKAAGIIRMIDNSHACPINQRPIEMGIDLVMQTATKYIGGHSDTLGGVLCGTAAMMRKIFTSEYLAIGSGMQPFNAWLLLRGLRTLTARLDKINASTIEMWQFLKTHPAVESVIFPLDPDFPQYELAKKQMKSSPGLISFFLKLYTVDAIEQFCNKLQHIRMAVSWGGYESLLLPKCASMPKAEFNLHNKEHRMCRLYVGLEEPAFLQNDINQALIA
jgi:cystathionine beta-lyase/cystathionine gamma-synthase